MIAILRPFAPHAALAVAAALVGAAPAHAAEQGELGTGATGSTGSIDMSIEKNFAVRISGLEDIEFGSHTAADAPFVEEGDFCVYSTTGRFNLTMRSANAVGAGDAAAVAMAMANTSAVDDNVATQTPLPYTVAVGGAPVADGVPLLGLAGDPVNQDCGGADNDNVDFTVTIDQASFTAAAPGVYADTLTMFVEPL